MAGLCGLCMQAARAGLVQTRFRRAKRKTTVAIDEGRVARHILRLLGNKLAEEVTRADCQRIIDAIPRGELPRPSRPKPGASPVSQGARARRRRRRLARRNIHVGDQRRARQGAEPARGLDRRADEAGDRVLSRDELRGLGKAMGEAERGSPMAVNALQLIALTGLRRSEAYGLRWSEIDFTASCIRLSKVGVNRADYAADRRGRDGASSKPSPR